MDNYETIAYAVVAVEKFKKDGKELTPTTLIVTNLCRLFTNKTS
jgi:hypothetical protein